MEEMRSGGTEKLQSFKQNWICILAHCVLDVQALLAKLCKCFVLEILA